MLSSPEAGWSTFQLNQGTSYGLSYLTDIPVDWLDQAIHGLEKMDVFSVRGFCEPGRMICTVSFWSCYILFEEEDREPSFKNVEQHHVTMIDFCRLLYSDISENFEDWVHWCDWIFGDENDEQYYAKVKEREDLLRNKLEILKHLIDENEEHFQAGRFIL